MAWDCIFTVALASVTLRILHFAGGFPRTIRPTFWSNALAAFSLENNMVTFSLWAISFDWMGDSGAEILLIIFYVWCPGPAVPLSTTDTKTSDISNSFQVLYIAVCVVGGLALLLTMACGVFFCRNYKQRMRSLTHRHSDDVDERSTQLQADVSNRNSDARDMTSNPAYGIVLNTSCHTTLLTPLLPIQNAIEMTESIAYGLQPDSDLGLQSSHYPVEAVNSTAEDGDYSYIDPRF